MSRFAETETAVVARLHALKVGPEISVNLSDLVAPLHAAGFSQDEITAVMDALEQDKIVSYAPGNRLLILKDLPD